MINLNDLWIGDFLKIISTNQKGKFEGIDPSGKAKIKIKKDIVLANANDLELTEEELPIQVQKTNFIPPKKKEFDIIASVNFERKLDLHMENLSGYNPRNWPTGVLPFQISKCRTYINEAIELKVPRIVIVHGVGHGILRKCVEGLLHEFPNIEKFSSLNEGSLEVWLNH